MDIEYDESNNQEEEEELDLEPLNLKTDRRLVLTHEAQSIASSIGSRRRKEVLLNRHIDPRDTAHPSSYLLKARQFGYFEHYLTKNKHRHERVEVMNVVRELAESKDHVLSGRVSDKLERSKMILRVVSKEDNGIVMIEDETGKQKMMVRNGTVWVGMIALMEVVWSDNCYRLQAVFDLGAAPDKRQTLVREPFSAFRMLFVKGSLLKNDSKDNIGLKIIMDELKHLRSKEGVDVDCLIVMGPLLSAKNKAFNGFLELTYEEEALEQIKVISDETKKHFNSLQIVYMPSTDDLNSLYPIPQPKFHFWNEQVCRNEKTIHFTSNPGFLHLVGGTQNVKLDLINLDLLTYIDQNRKGVPFKQMMQENIETYFKQPFYLTNAMDEPFDETNLPNLYNQGVFGDIIVTSSRKSPPFAREVRGKVFVNIGCLGIDEQNLTQKHYMTLVSVYEGSGPVAPRTKVQAINM